MIKAVVSLSGGMDSVTTLADAMFSQRKVIAVGFTYGSKHNAYEHEAAKAVAQHYGIDFVHFDLSAIMAGFNSNLLKSGGDIPEGHYQQENMSQTVVPGRNLIFASVLAGFAWSKGADEVWLGIHSGDHAIYPDCRPEFFQAMNAAVELGSDGKVSLKAPFLMGNKTTIIRLGRELGVPYHLTRTCYKDQEIACGRCGACQERLEAFAANGMSDPIPYESRDLLPKAG